MCVITISWARIRRSEPDLSSVDSSTDESLASENASRLAAMQRADNNIAVLQENLNRTFHRLHQNGIDEELFNVISGFEALTAEEKQ
jgi:F0F1-type ATP synthase gamma subunit